MFIGELPQIPQEWGVRQETDELANLIYALLFIGAVGCVYSWIMI